MSRQDTKVDHDKYYEDSGLLSGECLDQDDDYPEDQDREQEQDTPSLDKHHALELEEQHHEMRLDSGLDLGNSALLTEDLEHMHISHCDQHHRNDLTTEADTTLTVSPPLLNIVHDEQGDQAPPPWQIYFAQDDDGDTQLHIAIMQRLNEAVYALLEMCPDPMLLDIRNDHGQAPIHLAVLTQQPHIVRRLLIAGAKVNTVDCNGNTALHLACAGGDRACLTALTIPLTIVHHRGPSPTPRSLPQALDQKNYDGEACVHLAAVGGYLDVLKHLVWFGANINATENKSGRTVLHLAIEQSRVDMVDYLVKECPMVWLGARTYSGHTALQLVHGDIRERVMRELFSGAGYNYQDDESDYDDSEDYEDEDSDISDEIHSNNSNYFNSNMRVSEVNVA